MKTSSEKKSIEFFMVLTNRTVYLAKYTIKSYFKVYKLLKKHNAAWVIADSPNYPRADEVTADFVYLRMHGSKVLFTSGYTKKELSFLAGKVKKWLKNKKDVYVYFNNDAMGYAVENAKMLKQLII